MDSKAQIIGQVFVFILAGLIFVLILTYGYTAITKLIDTKKTVDIIEFKTSIEQKTEAIRTSTGSVHKAIFSLPLEYTELCAVDPHMTQTHSNAFKIKHPLFYNAWHSDPALTIFTKPLLETPLNIKDIAVNGPLFDEPGFLCLPITNGRIILKLTGQGLTTKISAWENT